jgi:hypothetical protein
MPAMVDVTPYPDVNTALTYFLEHTRAILGERFRAMYLDGSLALGDFDPCRSDIDFVMVTDADLPADVISALQAMHARFVASASPWAAEIEASYIPEGALRRYEPTWKRHPRIERGDQTLEMADHEVDWVIHRHVLREYGLALAGPAPRRVIDPVSPDDLRRAVVELMRIWWAPMAREPAERHHLLHRGYRVYAVQTMCRILYTLETGQVVSKPVAARWARETLGRRWAGLIHAALAWEKDAPSGVAEPDLQQTVALIQLVADRCEHARQLLEVR